VQRFSDNAQGAIFMAVSTFGYVVNDTMVKLAAEELQLYQTIFMRGSVITVIIAVIARRSTRLTDLRHHLSFLLVLRVTAEVIGTIAFLHALVRLPIANVTAILQVVPLAVTLAAALFLGEKVGWRRYVAIGVGFIGVVVIVRPDAGGFSQFTLLALVAVVMVTIRDLATRRLPPDVPSVLVAFLTAVSIATMGLLLSIPQGWNPITSSAAVAILAASAFLTVGYLFSIRTVRIGDLSFAAPMRYTVLLWAMLLGIFVFNEIPDAWTIAGSSLIVVSGLYSVARERSLGASEPRRRVFNNRPGV
jgi:drug/metabolite transporter (DMT)-like permease